MEYITNIPNRRTLRQILGGNDKKIAMGVAHAIAGDDTGDEQDTIFNRTDATLQTEVKNLRKSRTCPIPLQKRGF